ncbi:hypothetical protein LWI28_010814 [Acer negundo]|uniref:VOC domain-containing protein n=1 Tax=Acer negundo TaxID=4023 RepID=A0AAD5ITN1_ACENE|nr:hypothetical protein LWI28_010814 [Acer negundo]KAK4845882.1 hypothetical protein QYF36_010155 [Acer negundo]
MAAVDEVQNGGGAEKAVTVAAVTFTALKPQLLVEAPKATDAVQFYKNAFGAEETGRTMHTKRKAEQELPLILSAQLQIGSFTILVSDLADDSAAAQEKSAGTGCVLCLETEDVEAALSKAVSAGAVADGEVVDGDGMCCGGRVGKLKDPYGFTWLICSPVETCKDEVKEESRKL